MFWFVFLLFFFQIRLNCGKIIIIYDELKNQSRFHLRTRKGRSISSQYLDTIEQTKMPKINFYLLEQTLPKTICIELLLGHNFVLEGKVFFCLEGVSGTIFHLCVTQVHKKDDDRVIIGTL